MILALVALCVSASSAHAWYKHDVLMPWVVRGLSAETRAKLALKVQAPCGSQDQAMIAQLGAELKLNPKAKLEPTVAGGCAPARQVSLESILLSGFTDDPDRGIDSDLDLSADQEFMGGKTGPSSQGYRHMYFQEWNLRSPIASFHRPAHAMGAAPERAQLLAEKAMLLMQSGQLAWGARVLAWALHYAQDLAQPFHAAKTPSLAMIAPFDWSYLDKGVTNYHWAYEGYVLARLRPLAQQSETKDLLAQCLKHSEGQARVYFDPASGLPRDLALAVAESSMALASDLGRATVALFGPRLRTRECDLPANRCMPNYDSLFAERRYDEARAELDDVSCRALSNASWASARLIEWVLR